MRFGSWSCDTGPVLSRTIVHVLPGLGEGIGPCPLWHPGRGALRVWGGGLRTVRSLCNCSFETLLQLARSKSDVFPKKEKGESLRNWSHPGAALTDRLTAVGH